jgi:hypothetical protein
MRLPAHNTIKSMLQPTSGQYAQCRTFLPSWLTAPTHLSTIAPHLRASCPTNPALRSTPLRHSSTPPPTRLPAPRAIASMPPCLPLTAYATGGLGAYFSQLVQYATCARRRMPTPQCPHISVMEMADELRFYSRMVTTTLLKRGSCTSSTSQLLKSTCNSQRGISWQLSAPWR